MARKVFGSFALKAATDPDAPEGSVLAVFSTFDVRDKTGDIIRPSAFEGFDGQDVLMVRSHDWDALAIGKGRIQVDPDRALFDGAFWLDTVDGEQAYRKVRNAGALQEWSWGFQIAPGGAQLIETDDGGLAREITKIARIFEVSPVLVGAGEGTRTLAVKGLAAEPLCRDCHSGALTPPEAAAGYCLGCLAAHPDLYAQVCVAARKGPDRDAPPTPEATAAQTARAEFHGALLAFDAWRAREALRGGA